MMISGRDVLPKSVVGVFALLESLDNALLLGRLSGGEEAMATNG